MSNREVGEFSVTLGGHTYKFRLGLRFTIAFQEAFVVTEVIRDAHTGKAQVVVSVPKWDELEEQVFQHGRMKYIRAFLWAALQEYHPEVYLDAPSTNGHGPVPISIDRVIEKASEEQIQQLLRELSRTIRPDPEDVKALGGDGPRPPKAQSSRRKRGNGARSTSTLAESD